MAEEVDVVVIGSGYGGTIPATRCGQAGMSVVVLERGRRMATEDFEQSDDPRYITQVIDLFVTRSNIAFRTGTVVGGASIPMDGGHFRAPAKTFAQRDSADRRFWPEAFDVDTIRPYYQRAEDMLRVRQIGWGEVPKAGGLFAKMLDRVGASAERARMNYLDCNNCGFCTLGCRFDKKVTLLHSYIPVAEEAGVEFRAGAAVTTIAPEGVRWKVTYVKDGETREIIGNHCVVGCGGIHTPGLLLRNRANLPNLSRHCGEHFNNNGEHAFIGILPPEFDDLSRYQCFKGMDNAGIMSFHWFDSDGFTLHPGGGFEPSVLAAGLEAADHPVLPKRSWGLAYKRFMESVYPHRLIGFSALGLAEGHNAIVVDDNGNPDLEARDRTSTDAYLDNLEARMAEVSAQTGVILVPAVPRKLAGTTSAHLLSACRMSDRADDGVVDPSGQVWGHENLWVCDASAIPAALGVNPALSISAVAERTAEQIIAKG